MNKKLLNKKYLVGIDPVKNTLIYKEAKEILEQPIDSKKGRKSIWHKYKVEKKPESKLSKHRIHFEGTPIKEMFSKIKKKILRK